MRALAAAVPLALSTCSYPAADKFRSPDPLPPIAEQRDAARLAMTEHLLADYFAAHPAASSTVCAAWHDGREEEALAPDEELALMARFPQLAPMTRCSRTADGWRDEETQMPAVVVALHNFTCASKSRCAGWAGELSDGSVSASILYRGTWDGEAWQFRRDSRTSAP